MKPWQRAWRKGFAPNLTREQLTALRDGLAANDQRIIQGATTSPPPLMCVQNWPVEYACVLGFCGWQGNGLETVAEVEEFFARLCYDCDQSLTEDAGCHQFLNWVDETPRAEMVLELLAEVELSLSGGNKFPPDGSPESTTPE